MSNQEAEKNKNIHKGHRKRVIASYLKNGLSTFNEHQILELILFFSIKISDTNPLAHELINKFGSLDKVLEAPTSELMTVKGIGERSATLIKLFLDVNSKFLTSKSSNIKVITTTEDTYKILLPYFYNSKEEKLGVVCLDNAKRILAIKMIESGSPGNVKISVRKIVEQALLYKSAAVIIAHNHPSGIAIPTREDILVTGNLKVALSNVEVKLYDHIILTDDDCVSFKDSNMIT